jgi:predicted transposase/invertase (TIGR01784 family)
LLRVDTLELPKLPELPSGGEPRVEWLSFLKAKDKKAMDMLAERNPDIEKAVSCLTHLSADDQARQRYEAHLKWQRDMWAYKKDAEEAVEKGLARGRAEGRAEGLEQGLATGVQRVARRMLQRQRPIAEIMEDTGLSAAEIAALQ